MRSDYWQFALFEIEINDEPVCTATAEAQSSGDTQQFTCSAVVNISEGNQFKFYKFQ